MDRKSQRTWERKRERKREADSKEGLYLKYLHRLHDKNVSWSHEWCWSFSRTSQRAAGGALDAGTQRILFLHKQYKVWIWIRVGSRFGWHQHYNAEILTSCNRCETPKNTSNN